MFYKRLFTLIIAVMIVVALSLTAFAAEATTIVLQIGNPEITIDGQALPIDENGTTPLIENSRTLLPVRAVVEAMGGGVAWQAETRTISLTLGRQTILLTIGSATAYLNGEAQGLDVTPVIINERTLLPIRFIAESFGYEVDWDETTRTVTLTGQAATDDSQESAEEAEVAAGTDGKILIAYFSHTGNTEGIAEQIQALVGGDLVEIVTADPYPSVHEETVAQASREQADDYRPQLATTIANMAEYDVVYLGYPIWWSTMPMAMFTFLEEYDFSGKTIIPFCTHGGSRLGRSVTDIQALCPEAEVLEGLAISRDALDGAQQNVEQWLRNLGMIA